MRRNGREGSDGEAPRSASAATTAVSSAERGDDFGCVLAEFGQEVCDFALKVARERHVFSGNAATSSGGSHGPLAGGRRKEQAPRGAAASTSAVAGSCSSFSRGRVSPGPSALESFVNKEKANGAKCETRSPLDVSCVQGVALNVWATLGFFSPPPFEFDSSEQPDGRQSRRSRRGDTDVSPPPIGAGEEDEESVFCVVSALEMYYGRALSSDAGVPLGGAEERKVNGGEREQLLNDEMLRNGLWRVLFNAVFYCTAAPFAGRRFRPKDLECVTGSVEDRYDVLDASSSSFVDDLSDDSERRGEEEENFGCVFAKLRWHTQETSTRKTRGGRHQEERQRPCDSSSPQSGGCQATFRRGVGLNEGVVEERRPPQFSCLSSPSPSFSSEGMTAAESLTGTASKRAELIERLRRRVTPFGGRLELPLPITPWCFVVRALARLGYMRDAFYTQTPSCGSIHELVLALLWITKKYQLVAVAEYVQLRDMYPFLLYEGSTIQDEGNNNNKNYDGCDNGAQGRCVSTAETATSSAGETLLRCFPAAVPWPPASFAEKEHISHRLEQLQRILPESQKAEEASSMRLPEFTRRLLSVQRLITLSMNRLECALHQRAEQTASLGLHSALDVQLCHPAHHDAYRRLCSGLQHLRGMETRVRETTQQLSQLGSLVARALRQEVAIERQQPLCAALKKAMEDDDLAFLRRRQQQQEREEQQQQHHQGHDHWGEGENAGRDRPSLHETLTRFRATGTKEQLADLWAFLRRAAQVDSGGGSRGTARGDVAESHAVQARLAAQVRQNMAARYSLDAALKAELQTWRLHRSGGARDDDDDGGGGGGGGEGGLLLSRRGASDRRRRVQSKSVRRPLVKIDLLLHHISSHSRQATAVGRPTENATTSACLETERLRETLCALREQEEYLKRSAEEQQATQDALRAIHDHGLRVVHRKR